MRTVHALPAPGAVTAGFGGCIALLGLLAAGVGLGVLGWAVGVLCGGTLTVLVVRALARHGARRLGPADDVTLARAVLACGVAALVAGGPGPGAASRVALVALAAVALALDAVDGPVARRTGTVSAFGARFDMECDAFLIAVLSIDVARAHGPWVLAAGAARYGFVAAGRALPWLTGALPARYWRKVVAATLGVALTVAAAAVIPDSLATALLVVALAMLAESFGRDVLTLWLRRRPAEAPARMTEVGAGRA